MDTCTHCGARFSSPAAIFCGGCGTRKGTVTPPADATVIRQAPPVHMLERPQQVQQTPGAQPAQVFQPIQPAPDTPVLASAAQPVMRVGMLGSQRSTLAWIVFTYFTMGIASILWTAGVHGDMKRYTGKGIGAGAAALYLIPIVGWLFLWVNTPARVGRMYAEHGLTKPCSGWTVLWSLIPLVGPAIYFVKINEALNSLWRSLAA